MEAAWATAAAKGSAVADSAAGPSAARADGSAAKALATAVQSGLEAPVVAQPARAVATAAPVAKADAAGLRATGWLRPG